MDALAAETGLTDQLGGIATRLADIASNVTTEAEAATAAVRGMSDHAHRIAALAAALGAAADVIEADVRQQSLTLTEARSALAANKPVVDSLASSIDGVASISGLISAIARESRILSLNARIEAARAGGDVAAFGVVATEMSALTDRSQSATDAIRARAMIIAQDVRAASDVVVAHKALVIEQDDLLAASLHGASRQRETAATLVSITADTVATVDAAATAIGRVGANAVAARLLARQITKLAAAKRDYQVS